MKKIFFLILLLVMSLFSLVSCGDTSDSTPEPYAGWKMACHKYMTEEYSKDVEFIDCIIYDKGLLKVCYTYTGKAFGGYTCTVYLVCHYNTQNQKWIITGYYDEEEYKANALIEKYKQSKH